MMRVFFDSQFFIQVPDLFVVKLPPIVDTNDWKISKRQMMFFQINFEVLALVFFARGLALTHLVLQSTATITYLVLHFFSVVVL